MIWNVQYGTTQAKDHQIQCVYLFTIARHLTLKYCFVLCIK